MKKILIDLYKVKNPYSGLGQFSLQFARELSDNYSHEFEFHFLLPRTHEIQYSPLIKIITDNPLLRFWKASHEQYDLWHSLYQMPTHRPPRSFKHLMTIHDLNFLIEKEGKKQEKYLSKLIKDVNSADHISTISNFTKSQIKDHLPVGNTDIEVIYNGIKHLPSSKAKKPTFINDDYAKSFFSISLFSAKKNLAVLLPVMKNFPDTRLVLAGDHKNEYGNKIKEEIVRLGLENQILLPGKISDLEKVYLYQHCEAFLFPSIAEGFGMPVIEAMQFGKPAFLSRLTSLPEVGGDAAHYFDNFEPSRMTEQIKSGLRSYHANKANHSFDIKDQASKFTWKRSMDSYIDFYHRIVT